MTSRIVVITGAIDRGSSFHDEVDEQGRTVIDTSPDHRVYTLEGINCSVAEFMAWFDVTQVDHALIICGDQLIDLGGAAVSLSVGDTLEIPFPRYFDALIDSRIAQANRELDQRIRTALSELGLWEH
ncbi:hypothetical protein KW507_15665 [Vibrio fluvialis]|nr:hypothetical protein [Vibrio fluvialis]